MIPLTLTQRTTSKARSISFSIFSKTYLFERDRGREKEQAGGVAVGEADSLHWEPSVGLDPRTVRS